MAKKRRKFTPEYKAEVVKLVKDSQKSISSISRDLGLTETSIRAWVRQHDIDAGNGSPGAPMGQPLSPTPRNRRTSSTTRSRHRATISASASSPTSIGPTLPILEGLCYSQETMQKNLRRTLLAEPKPCHSIFRFCADHLGARCIPSAESGIATSPSFLWR